METYFYRQRRKKKKLRTLTAFFVTGLLFLITYVVLHVSLHKESKPVHLISPVKTESHPLSTSETTKSNELSQTVESALSGAEGTYGIVINNLHSGQGYQLNEHKRFDTASLYKLWVMAVVYQDIQAGKLREDQVLSQDVSVLNDEFEIASESAEQTSGTITLSVADALKKMITVSDNYAALLLTEKVHLSHIAAFLQQNGFAESSVGINGDAPSSTASDIALFLEKLYNGKLADKTYTKEMIQLLQEQQLNRKLPKYLPDSLVVAHKTGELDTYSHDAGIVYAPSGNYIIVILTESDDPPSAEERIAEISKDVYNYFTQEK